LKWIFDIENKVGHVIKILITSKLYDKHDI